VIDKLERELWHLDGKTITCSARRSSRAPTTCASRPRSTWQRSCAPPAPTVRIYDPVALDNVAKEAPDLARFDDIDAALAGAHAAVVCTDWDEVKAITPQRYLDALAYPIVVDGRNVHDPDEFLDAGLHYYSMGRQHRLAVRLGGPLRGRFPVRAHHPGGSGVTSQSWFWTDRWQRMECEADVDIAAGRVAEFDDVEGFLADLET
jgi:hypothetical protein